MKKLVLGALTSFAVSLGILFLTDGKVSVVFDEMLAGLHVVALLTLTLSVSLFTYVDGILKDLSELKNRLSEEKYSLAVKKIASLRKEIIINVAIIVAFYLFERFTKGIFISFELLAENHQFQWIAISIRLTCMIVVLLTTIDLLYGFITSLKFREILANRSK